MLNQVIARVQSEPGWRIICYSRNESGVIEFSTHSVSGWAFELTHINHSAVHAVPTSLSGEILTRRPGYLGVIGPEDNLDDFISKCSKIIESEHYYNSNTEISNSETV